MLHFRQNQITYGSHYVVENFFHDDVPHSTYRTESYFDNLDFGHAKESKRNVKFKREKKRALCNTPFLRPRKFSHRRRNPQKANHQGRHTPSSSTCRKWRPAPHSVNPRHIDESRRRWHPDIEWFST